MGIGEDVGAHIGEATGSSGSSGFLAGVLGTQIDSVTSTTMTISWTEPAQGSATEYRVYDINGLLGTEPWPASSTIITGLTPDTFYTIWVVTSDGTNESGVFITVGATTSTLTLNAPTFFSIDLVTDTTATVSWTPPAQGDATDYRVKDASGILGTIAFGATGMTLTGLTSSTLYTMWVVTTGLGSESAPSNTDSATTQTASGWQLPIGNYYDNQAIVPFKLIHPLPDGGAGKEAVNTWARHRWAHSQFEYRIPVTVQGGAYPYHFELIGVAGTDYPADMTIGANYNDVDYGIISWTPNTESQNDAWTITAWITDQTGRFLSAVFPLTLDDTMFAIQDPAATGGLTGTWADPYETFSNWYGGDSTTVADTAGKIMVYRGGTHNTISASDKSYQLEFGNGSLKPMGHIGVPGESVIFDNTNADIFAASSGFAPQPYNFFFADIDITNNPGINVSDNRSIYLGAGACQAVLWNLEYTNMAIGSAHNNNEACIYLNSIANTRHYITVKDITTYSLPDSGQNGFSLAIIYSAKYLLIEGCGDTTNSLSDEYLFVKASCQHTTVRKNTIRPQNSGVGVLYLYNATFDAVSPSNQEVLYNNVKDTNDTYALGVNAKQQGNIGPISIFRNTFEGVCYYTLNPTDDDIDFFRNIVVSATAIDSDFNVPAGESNVYSTTTTDLIDANGNLTGSGLIYLGTDGHEVSA